jgi:hypothetical protein
MSEHLEKALSRLVDTRSEAQKVCNYLIDQLRLKMQNLPNKKRNSGLTKE